MSTEKEIRKFLEEKVDPYMKPMLMEMISTKPEDVYEFMRNWVHSKGLEIKGNLDLQNQVQQQSADYDEFKKSVIEAIPDAQEPLPEVKKSQPPSE